MISIGRIVYRFFFRPLQPITYNLKHFGIKGWYKYKKGEWSMQRSAAIEHPIALKNNASQEITVCYLTGKNYWYQTIYAIKSLHLQLKSNFKVKIYSDGTLTDKHKCFLKNFFPDIEIISEAQADAHLDSFLPQSKFPTLRYLRNWHPFFKRLIDIHSSSSWSLHLDSDMLFFNAPYELIDAFKSRKAIYMKELLPEPYYVDKLSVLKEKYDIDCLTHVNGGIIGYDGNLVNYEDLEDKAKILIDNYVNSGPARIEQTLMSYILYQQNAIPLDDKKYTIVYDGHFQRSPNQTLIHYIFKAKLPFFSEEWKRIQTAP